MVVAANPPPLTNDRYLLNLSSQFKVKQNVLNINNK